MRADIALGPCFRMHGSLHATHDPMIVLLSVLVAVVASLVSLDLAERLRATAGRARLLWLWGAAFALGGGIWSMHFIAMLAFSMGVQVSYDLGLTLLSLIFAIGSTAAGYALVAGEARISPPRLLAAGAVTGAGVAVMHYTGMAAMIMPLKLGYDVPLVTVSVIIAVVAASAAFWLSFNVDRAWHKFAASIVMGAAIAGMHYTGMAAARFSGSPQFDIDPHAGGTASLMAGAITMATLIILALGFASASVNRRFDRRARKEAEHLRRTELRFQSMVRNSSDIVFLLDRRHVIIYDTPAAERQLSASGNSLIGRTLESLVAMADRPKCLAQIEALMTKGKGSVQVELAVTTASGALRQMAVTLTNLLDEEHLNAIVANLHNVTELKQAAAELRAAKDRAEAANRAKSAFLANVSHELRTPLNSIIGFSDLLLSQRFGALGHTTYGDYARDINVSGKQLLTVINSILDYSRAESGNIRLESMLVDPIAEAELCLRLFQEQIAAKSIAIETRKFDERFMLLVDRNKIRQIFMNLLSNAVKFTPDHGRIGIVAEITEDRACAISVQDNGMGMSEQEIAQALVPFGQVQAGHNRAFEGLGLGLSIVKALVELHDAKLEIGSARGVGTPVTITFPADRLKYIGTQLAAGAE